MLTIDRPDRMMKAVSPKLVTLAIAFAIALLVADGATIGVTEAAQNTAPAECHEVQECRRLALEARERGAYETFHDLAWRAVQTGRRNDPELLYLLARAQSLSNRPTDALVTLKRLADMGVVYDAAANEDLRQARALPGWSYVAVLIDRLAAAGAPATPPKATPPEAPRATAPEASRPNVSETPGVTLPATPRATAPAAPRATAPAPPRATAAPAPGASNPAAPRPTPPKATAPIPELKVEVLPVGGAVHFSAPGYVPGGLAYDSVSRRFLVGDLMARKLLVVGDGSDHPVDMVRAESAKFQDVTALEIDPRRGDLWVVSTGPSEGTGALHKLQLISGRMLSVFEAAAELQPVRFTDVTVTPAGTVLVLDDVGRRVLGLQQKASTLAAIARLEVEMPTSVAASGDGEVAYVAHRDGLVRLDLATKKASTVAGPDGIDLGHFERIRWHRDALVGVQTTPSGERRFVRLRLNNSGTRVIEATVIEASLPAGSGPTFATITGDDLYYLVTKGADAGVRPDRAPDGENVDVAVQRIRLR